MTIPRLDLLEVLKRYSDQKCQFKKLMSVYEKQHSWLSRYDFAECHQEFEHIHHIDKNRNNNNIENLIPLCSWCHKDLHVGIPVVDDSLNRDAGWKKGAKSYIHLLNVGGMAHSSPGISLTCWLCKHG